QELEAGGRRLARRQRRLVRPGRHRAAHRRVHHLPAAELVLMSAFTSGAPRSASSYIFGRAGKGLDNADWAVSQGAAKAGQAGERKTASVLDPLAGPNAVVLHDLMIPHDKYTANI